MEKISHIVPASTRQVWSSGEVERPKRVSEPSVEERALEARTRISGPLPVRQETLEPLSVSGEPHKGGSLNTMA